MDWFDDWALTLAVFLPLVGMALVLLIPQAQETAIKAPRSSRRSPRSPSASGSSPTSTTTRAAKLQFGVNEPWIEVINSRYHLGVDGISLPLLILSMLVVIAVHHLLVGPLPRAAQPEGVPRADPAARSRA